MSQSCPLCGKNKPEGTLFCNECTRRVQAEYEVNIPEEIVKEKDDCIVSAEEIVANSPLVENNRAQKKKRIAWPLLFILSAALLAGAFFIYNGTIRKGNLDRSGWDEAVKLNSTQGYLAYMEAFPQGKHFDEAQESLIRLKSDEAQIWEKMKMSDNVTELREFLNLHSGSPYTSMVKTRIDSLVWMGSLKTNTAQSYSDYIILTEDGDIGGGFIAEAKKRYDLLFISQPQNSSVLDSIRTTVDGFFISLSDINHSGMFRFLAPAVSRFFNLGSATREKITGQLLVTAAQSGGTTLKFIPDLESVRYEVKDNNLYSVNVPLQKSYQKEGVLVQVYGYIVHLQLDPLFQIVSIYETKPYPEAP